jgi:hypothetical protein
MRDWKITLFPDEIAAAVAVASRRRLGCQRNRTKPTHFEPRDRWGVEVESACAEVALSRLLNLAWTGASGVARPDVGGMIEVRHSSHDDAHLLIWEGDDPRVPQVLVTGHDGDYSARGWQFPVSAWRPEWRRHKSWWVPQAELRSMDELLRMVARNAAAWLRADDSRPLPVDGTGVGS